MMLLTILHALEAIAWASIAVPATHLAITSGQAPERRHIRSVALWCWVGTLAGATAPVWSLGPDVGTTVALAGIAATMYRAAPIIAKQPTRADVDAIEKAKCKVDTARADLAASRKKDDEVAAVLAGYWTSLGGRPPPKLSEMYA